MKKVNFTLEQKELLDAYFIIGHKMIRFTDRKEITIEKFKAFWKDENGDWQELTAEDFCWFNTDIKDFLFADGNYLLREEMPEEVVEMLHNMFKY